MGGTTRSMVPSCAALRVWAMAMVVLSWSWAAGAERVALDLDSVLEETHEKTEKTVAKALPKGLLVGAGYICQDYEDLDDDSGAQSDQVDQFLQQRGLTLEYSQLKRNISYARTHTLWWRGWTDEKVEQIVYVASKSFLTKGVDLLWTRQFNWFKIRRKFCMTDIGAVIPPDLRIAKYRDGTYVVVNCRGGVKQFPFGVAGQQLKSLGYHASHPSKMSGEVFKMLYDKGLLDAHGAMAKRMASRPRKFFLSPMHVDSEKWDLLALEAARPVFLSRGVFVWAMVQDSVCCSYSSSRGTSCTRYYYEWLEYVDLSITGSGYVPVGGDIISARSLALWAMCHRNPAVQQLAEDAMLGELIPRNGCGQFVGATATWFDNCKCIYMFRKPYCGSERISNSSTFGLDPRNPSQLPPSCAPGNMYCAVRTCKPLPMVDPSTSWRIASGFMHMMTSSTSDSNETVVSILDDGEKGDSAIKKLNYGPVGGVHDDKNVTKT